MHEFGIAKALVENVESAALSNSATEVSEVIVEIGELAFIGSDQLKFAYDILKKENSMLSKSKLTLEFVEAVISCENCGYKGTLKRYDEPESHFITPVFACPTCHGKVDIIKGRECIIKNIRMTVDDDVQVQ